MIIRVVSGVGYGSTEISAFDAALREVGLEHFNLIPLSSVIPPGAEVIQVESLCLDGYGDRAYVVLARNESCKESVGAAIAWAQEEDGRGIFAEGVGKSSFQAERDALLTLREMQERRGRTYVSEFVKSEGVTSSWGFRYVSAIVVAFYDHEGWHGSGE